MILKLRTTKKREPAFNSRGFDPNQGGSKNKGTKNKYAERVDCHEPSIRNPNILLWGKGIFTMLLSFSFSAP